MERKLWEAGVTARKKMLGAEYAEKSMCGAPYQRPPVN